MTLLYGGDSMGKKILKEIDEVLNSAPVEEKEPVKVEEPKKVEKKEVKQSKSGGLRAV